MVDISVSVAFFAGIISFFAPCVIPLLPAYIGYITGVSVNDLKKNGYKSYRKQIFVSSILYVVGFSLIFVLSGAAIAGIGVLFRRYDFIIQKLGGLILLVLGLEFAGVIKFSRLSYTKQFALPKWSIRIKPLRSFVLGIIFAAAWTPCIGPILGSILALAATSDHIIQGGFLLFVYSLGISVPFLVVSFTLVSAPQYLAVITKRIDKVAMVSGILLAILGVLLITDTYKHLNAFMYSFMPTVVNELILKYT